MYANIYFRNGYLFGFWFGDKTLGDFSRAFDSSIIILQLDDPPSGPEIQYFRNFRVKFMFILFAEYSDGYQ